MARDLCRTMGHRTIRDVVQDWQNDLTRIRLQALVMEIFAADVPADPSHEDSRPEVPKRKVIAHSKTMAIEDHSAASSPRTNFAKTRTEPSAGRKPAGRTNGRSHSIWDNEDTRSLQAMSLWNSTGIPPLLPTPSEVMRWTWKVIENEKLSLVRSHMRGIDKTPNASNKKKRESQSGRRLSIGIGKSGLPGALPGLPELAGEGGLALSAAAALGKKIDEDTKNFAKACDELAFLRLDTEIGADGVITLNMAYDDPPSHGQNSGKNRRAKKEKTRASLVPPPE